MTSTVAALAAPASKAGVVAVTLLAAGAIVTPRERQRAVFALLALAIAPTLLIASLADSPQLAFARRSPLAAVALALAGALAVAGLAWLVGRNRRLLPFLIAVTLPFRLPIALGGDTANLLVPLYMVIAAGALAWAVPVLRSGTEDGREEPNRLDWALGAWLALFGICSLWSGDATKALQQAVFFYVPFSVLYLLLRRIDWTPELLRGCGLILLGLALIFSLFGFYEYFTETLILNPKLLISNEYHTYFRVNSVFFDPNIFGRFLMLVMIGVAAVLLKSASGIRVALCAGAFAVLLVALVTTLSQSSLVGLLAGLVALAAMHWPAKWVLATAGVLLAVGAVAIAIAPTTAGPQVHSLKFFNSESSGRASLVSGGLDLFASRPLAGWGSGSFSAAYRDQLGPGAPVTVSASHTTPVTVAAEQGVIGVVAYLALVVVALLQLLKGTRRSTARAAVAAGFVAMLVHSMVYAAFFEDPALWALLALGLAVPMPPTEDELREMRRREREAKRAGLEDDQAMPSVT